MRMTPKMTLCSISSCSDCEVETHATMMPSIFVPILPDFERSEREKRKRELGRRNRNLGRRHSASPEP